MTPDLTEAYDDTGIGPALSRLRVLADRHRAADLVDALDGLVAETSALRDQLSVRDYPAREELTVICTTCGRELDIVTLLGDSGHTTLGVRLDHFHV